MQSNIDISYAAMKEIIDILEKHGIPYSFNACYGITDLIQGHRLIINTELYTDELDEEDLLYNEG